MISESLQIKVSNLANSPGVYQFFDKSEKIIYVGKAKNLKKRVSSYFRKNLGSQKTKNLVKNIADLKHIVVLSESDALLLENSLIKKHQPKYNILLRDDKTYPWIIIKNERFPRVMFTRKVIKDGSEYFGPYTNKKTIGLLLDLIQNLFPLRTSNYNLSEKQINNSEEKLYLRTLKKGGNTLILGFGSNKKNENFDNIINEDEYKRNIDSVREILNGKFRHSKKLLLEKMKKYSDLMEFENAQITKEKLESLENYQSKSTVVSSKLNNIDVFSIISDTSHAYVNFLEVSHGRIVRFHNIEIKKRLDESEKDILLHCIINIRQKFNSKNKTVISPYDFSELKPIKFYVPKAGDNKKLLELSRKNATIYKLEKLKNLQVLDPERHQNRILSQMKIDLKLKSIPKQIDCFDNSNIQGSDPVAACVVFKNGRPSKRDYRKYNIKTVEGPDDYASMEEVISRRYRRLLDEKALLPDLIIIDGGKGQLSSSVKTLRMLGLDNLPIIGIAKRLEEIFYPNDSIPLYLDKRSETLKVIQHLRNEAHRFAISFHRNKRSARALASSFDQIPGIGKKTKLHILKRYKSLKKIKELSEMELSKEIGISKAKKIISFLNTYN